MPGKPRQKAFTEKDYKEWKENYPAGHDRTKTLEILPGLVARYEVE